MPEQWACLNCGKQIREKGPNVNQLGTYYHVVTGRSPCSDRMDGTHAYPDFRPLTPPCGVCGGDGYTVVNYGHTVNPDGSLGGRGMRSVPCRRCSTEPVS